MLVRNENPSWVSVLDESIQNWLDRYTFPGWMFVPHNSHPFVNKYNIIVCELTKVIYRIEIVEGKYRPREMGRKYFGKKGVMAGLMVWMLNLL